MGLMGLMGLMGFELPASRPGASRRELPAGGPPGREPPDREDRGREPPGRGPPAGNLPGLEWPTRLSPVPGPRHGHPGLNERPRGAAIRSAAWQTQNGGFDGFDGFDGFGGFGGFGWVRWV